MVAYLAKQRDNQKFNQSMEISITFLLITLFIIFAVRPAIITISGLIGQIKAKELQSEKMRSKINDVVSAQDLFSQIQEKYQLIESVLPNSPRYAQGVTQLEYVSQSAGINLNPVNIGLNDRENANQTSALRSYSVVINGRVNFSSVANLLGDLKKNRRLFQVDSVALSQARDKDVIINDGTVDISFQTDVLYWAN